MKSVFISVLVTALFHVTISQNPPGVPPQHQNVVPPQQQQQQYQQQQVNHQQQQQQQQVVNQHQNAPHEHVTEGRGGDTLRFKNDVHNTAHVMDHLQDVIETKPKEQMSEEELEFHYFKMHDYDGDNKLDGVEIGKALTHFHGDESRTEEASNNAKIFTDEEISNIVDEVLKENDMNNDGYIEYFEFKRNQDKHRSDTPAPDTQDEVQAKAKSMSDEEISSVVDLVLQEDDMNGDGYVEYYEFVAAQRKSKPDDIEETADIGPDFESDGPDPTDPTDPNDVHV